MDSSIKQIRELGPPEWLVDSSGVAAYLGLAESTIRKWVAADYIPHIKIGKMVKFNLHSIEKWLLKIESKGRTSRVRQPI